MEIAMCNLVLPPNWIIAKTFHYELLVKLALCIMTSTLVCLIA